MRYVVPLLIGALLASCTDATQPADDGSVAVKPGKGNGSPGGNSFGHRRAYHLELTVDKEIPQPRAPALTGVPIGDIAYGNAHLVIDGQNRLKFRIKIENPCRETFTAGHIHEITNANRTGPVVVSLFLGPPTNAERFTIEYDAEAPGTLNPPFTVARLLDIIASPERYYVNFHTVRNAAGLIRSDLTDPKADENPGQIRNHHDPCP